MLFSSLCWCRSTTKWRLQFKFWWSCISSIFYKNGLRCSTSSTYLKTSKKNRNLKIITNAEVEKIIFEGKKAVGVIYNKDNSSKEIRIKGEVILSAGSINSPKILELSGIGQGPLLKSHGIEVLSDIKGIGENLTDHLQTDSLMKLI